MDHLVRAFADARFNNLSFIPRTHMLMPLTPCAHQDTCACVHMYIRMCTHAHTDREGRDESKLNYAGIYHHCNLKYCYNYIYICRFYLVSYVF